MPVLTIGAVPAARRRPRRRWVLWGALVVALVILAVALFNWPVLAARPPWARPGNTLLASSAQEIDSARAQLSRLRVVDRPLPAGDYRRASFGEAWADTDGNGCNQRDDVLLRDALKAEPYRVARQGSCDHDVLAGTWIDPYTGGRITLTDAKQPDQAQSVQIDHVVALSVAWRYGANGWSDAERHQFANDLSNLVAAGGAANQAKGGSDAEEWQPVRAAQCGYAVRYVTVKATYGLPTDLVERAALTRMLATCP